jgi:hypothetical protein
MAMLVRSRVWLLGWFDIIDVWYLPGQLTWSESIPLMGQERPRIFASADEYSRDIARRNGGVHLNGLPALGTATRRKTRVQLKLTTFLKGALSSCEWLVLKSGGRPLHSSNICICVLDLRS